MTSSSHHYGPGLKALRSGSEHKIHHHENFEKREDRAAVVTDQGGHGGFRNHRYHGKREAEPGKKKGYGYGYPRGYGSGCFHHCYGKRETGATAVPKPGNVYLGFKLKEGYNGHVYGQSYGLYSYLRKRNA